MRRQQDIVKCLIRLDTNIVTQRWQNSLSFVGARSESSRIVRQIWVQYPKSAKFWVVLSLQSFLLNFHFIRWMYFRLSAALPLVKIAQIALGCFTRLTMRTIKALLRGVVVRDIVTIAGITLLCPHYLGYWAGKRPYCSPASAALVVMHAK